MHSELFKFPKKYDVIVIGGGHAGIEASLAAARMGCQTLLLVMNADMIGYMPCNPSVGGPAKGHLAREIDALGGEMGKSTDFSGLQFRMLNTKKGPAVQAPRAQCDKKSYQFRMKSVCERQSNLDIAQDQCTNILTVDGRVEGVETALGVAYFTTCVVVTTGTFLMGILHIGFSKTSGGRGGESAAGSLSQSLANIGIELGRLKTGTPARLNGRTVDYARLQAQFGDDPPPRFTYWADDLFHMEHFSDRDSNIGSWRGEFRQGSILGQIRSQLPCHITHTTLKTSEIVRKNLHRSPLYSGTIKGIGPRYCPSIEDKVVRFADKETHQIFLEPEGTSTDEVYVNGLSTSLPIDVQIELVHSVKGCEKAIIMRPGYAVEYDYSFPTQLHNTLETKVCRNLFFAGQINGTSGYEEAAAQGIVAGINAARRVGNRSQMTLRRDEAYIGVLIDDLVSKGTTEPYRMFTSRAEHRLLLRHDNADLRLSEIGYRFGLLPARNYNKFIDKKKAIETEIQHLQSHHIDNKTLEQLLRRPDMTCQQLLDDFYGDAARISPEIARQVETSIKYSGYILRQEFENRRMNELGDKQIPESFNFDSVVGLRTEARQKLIKIRPATVGQALRISGVSVSDISLLLVALKTSSPANNNPCT